MSGKLESLSYRIIIQATPEQVSAGALTDAAVATTQYFPNTAVESDWQPGSDYVQKRGCRYLRREGRGFRPPPAACPNRPYEVRPVGDRAQGDNAQLGHRADG